MVVLKKALAGAIAASMIVLPSVAQAGASKLSLANAAPVAQSARAGARTSAKSKAAPGSIVLIVLAGAAVVGGVVAAADSGNNASN